MGMTHSGVVLVKSKLIRHNTHILSWILSGFIWCPIDYSCVDYHLVLCYKGEEKKNFHNSSMICEILEMKCV